MTRKASALARSSTMLDQTKHSRRTILKAVAASAAAMGFIGSGGALGGGSTAAANSTATAASFLPVIAYISDARKGEIVVMAGTRETVRRDAELVARLVAIAKEAGDVVTS